MPKMFSKKNTWMEQFSKCFPFIFAVLFSAAKNIHVRLLYSLTSSCMLNSFDSFCIFLHVNSCRCQRSASSLSVTCFCIIFYNWLESSINRHQRARESEQAKRALCLQPIKKSFVSPRERRSHLEEVSSVDEQRAFQLVQIESFHSSWLFTSLNNNSPLSGAIRLQRKRSQLLLL